MSRIHRALERAANTRSGTAGSSSPADMPTSPGSSAAFDPSTFAVRTGGVSRDAVNRHVVTITDPQSYAAEEYRKLRARVLRLTEKDFQNTIMVTSAQSMEGKTVTAINLAVALAREIDHTVLLVDTDMRKPSVHTYLGLQPRYGLSDYLTSRVKLSDALVKTGIGKLVLLPAGSPPENPAELIASERMRDLIYELKGRYRDRYILCDSPPLLMTADSISLCDYVDGVIFVARSGVTTPKTAAKALTLMKGYTILGAVLNDAATYHEQSRYPNYYRYGSSGTAETAAVSPGGKHDGTANNA